MINDEQQASAVVERQLDAYNRRDIDAFMACYAEDVELLRFPPRRFNPRRLLAPVRAKLGQPRKRAMRDTYERLFRNTPDLHAEIVARVVHGNIVIDHERVTGQARGEFTTVAIYEVHAHLIRRVWFIT
jgi:hypothetical protein